MLQPTPGYVSTARPATLARWLWCVAALIVAMVVVGGITRLTESGLSITQWKPISGIIPPLNDAQWQAEFAGYQRIPEYQQLNRGMTLAGFKAIFFWEYIHRVLGRVIGLAFALPLLWFVVKRRVPRGYGWRLTGILALGGLQGAIGWWMVSSGLSVRTDVSHIRLAVHLMTALVILAAIVWTALDLNDLAHNPLARPARLRPIAIIALLLLAAQITFGAFTAGLDLKELGATAGALGAANATDASDNPVRAIESCRKPVIGAINGVAITGGFELALACDIVIASENARFADTHARVGVMPGWGLSQKLSRLIGLARAKELSLSGNFIDAATAERWGLVNRTVPAAELLPAAQRLAADIASADADFIADYKRLIDQGFALAMGEALALEHRVSSAANARVTPEAVEARRAAVQARGRAQ